MAFHFSIYFDNNNLDAAQKVGVAYGFYEAGPSDSPEVSALFAGTTTLAELRAGLPDLETKAYFDAQIINFTSTFNGVNHTWYFNNAAYTSALADCLGYIVENGGYYWKATAPQCVVVETNHPDIAPVDTDLSTMMDIMWSMSEWDDA